MYEGGYGWDRNDPGGPTKYGITCYDLAEFMGQKMDSMARWAPLVKAMTLQTADTIYNNKYATACAFDLLNVGKDCVVLDFGINSGNSRSIKFSQKIVGVAEDGILGPLTLKAINEFDPAGFVNDLCNARQEFLEGLSTFKEFGGGWTSRVHDLRTYSLNLINPPKGAELGPYKSKMIRIPLAYGKAYGDDWLATGV